MPDCIVRYAERSELERINELRSMVNDLHVNGRPDIFRPGFTDELGVDADCRRRGVARAIVDFCRQEARRKGYERIELNMWEFNEAALSFYEAVGFRTYRRYMELDV